MKLATGLGILVITAGCGVPGEGAGDGSTPLAEPDAGPVIQYRRDIQPIWDRACISCHQLFSPQLSAAESLASLGGRSVYCMSDGASTPFVVPGHPELSYLVYKISGVTSLTLTDRNPIWTDCEQLMPANEPNPDGGKPLSLMETDPAAVELVREWIAAGALDN